MKAACEEQIGLFDVLENCFKSRLTSVSEFMPANCHRILRVLYVCDATSSELSHVCDVANVSHEIRQMQNILICYRMSIIGLESKHDNGSGIQIRKCRWRLIDLEKYAKFRS